MTDRPQIGKNIYRQEITRGRNATTKARAAVRRIVEEQPGQSTQAILLARVALALGEIEEVLGRLDEIGREVKNTGQLPPLPEP